MSLTPVLLHMLFFHCQNFLALLALANMSRSCKGVTSSVEYLSPLLLQTGFGPLPDLFYHSPELYQSFTFLMAYTLYSKLYSALELPHLI